MSVSFTVTQINNNIDNLVKSRFSDIITEGEISSFNVSPSGHSYFIIKDEAGNANTYNITIKTSGSQTIDGESAIVLESPYSSVNLYSNGVDKFFIY